jgi:hypothetical protein
MPVAQTVGNYLTAKVPEAYWRESLNVAAATVDGLKVADVEVMANGMMPVNQLRNIDGLRASALVLTELKRLAQAYGARPNATNPIVIEQVFVEAVTLVLDRFGFLSLEELGIAWQLKESGLMKVSGAEAYGGQFSAGIVGKILGAYRDIRQTVMRPLLREIEEAQRLSEEAAKREKGEKWMNENFHLMLAAASKKYPSWEFVPTFWHELCKKRGYYKGVPKETFNEILERATQKAKEMADSHNLSQVKLAFWKREAFNEQATALTIAQRMAVWELIITNTQHAVHKFTPNVNGN